MRQHLICTIILLLSACANAQEFQPFPMHETSEWRASSSWLIGCWYEARLNYGISGQHTQNGKEYQIISYSGVQWAQPIIGEPNPECPNTMENVYGTAGLMRAENGKYYRSEIGSPGEGLYLDFTLVPGDTLWENEFAFVVDSVDWVDVNGRQCRRQWLCEPWTDGDCSYIWVIEGVGHYFGFLNSLYHFESGGQFYCYRENQIPVFPENVGQCLIISTNDRTAATAIEVYPNPTSGKLRIESNILSHYKVTDVMGNIILHGTINQKADIDLTGKCAGIYMLVISDEKTIETRKIILN